MQGFILKSDAIPVSPTRSGYRLPDEWNQNSGYWFLRYSHDACENEFVLEGYRQDTKLLVRVVEDLGAEPRKGEVMNVQVSRFNLLGRHTS